MPKLLINGTIDEFFLPDSWKFYWNELPGKKYLQYVPNGNHGLAGSYRSKNVFSFYRKIIRNKPIPDMDWKIDQDSITVTEKSTSQSNDPNASIDAQTDVSFPLSQDQRTGNNSEISPRNYESFRSIRR